MRGARLLESMQDGPDGNGGDGASGEDSLWSAMGSMFGMGGASDGPASGKKTVSLSALPSGKDHDTIHVFSLASGHLYERFLKIMMLSVVTNTKAPVKFWLLNNFLSPQFKKFIPRMARKHGFEYELVTYKWPSWLHQQTEKQRIIWGYKILMLDVLFPLSVKKIIYIDSDQTVRGDLRELYNMDLKGRPYAYTPFCDSNTEMEGYRFWKQGFWQGHLGASNYHISALYVVDLQRFRQIGAGDQLRVIYSQLSRDPNRCCAASSFSPSPCPPAPRPRALRAPLPGQRRGASMPPDTPERVQSCKPRPGFAQLRPAPSAHLLLAARVALVHGCCTIALHAACACADGVWATCGARATRRGVDPRMQSMAL
jgi:hypothetical protein